MPASGLFWAWLGITMLFQPASVMSLKLASVERADSREASCISHYASKLDGIRSGFGDMVRNRAEGFDLRGVAKRNDTKGKIFGAGFGSTATRSLDTALRLMNLQGEHAG